MNLNNGKIGGILSRTLDDNYIAQAIYFGFWAYWSYTDDLYTVANNPFVQAINALAFLFYAIWAFFLLLSTPMII